MFKKTDSPGPVPNNAISVSSWSRLQPTVNLKIVNKTNSPIFDVLFVANAGKTQSWESIFREKELNLDNEAWGIQGPNKHRVHRLTEQVDDVIREYSNVKQRYTVWLVELPTGNNVCTRKPCAKVPKLESTSTSMSCVPSTNRDSANTRGMQLNYMERIVEKIQALRPQQIKLVVGELEALGVDSESMEVVEDHLYHSLKLLRALFTDDYNGSE